MRENQVLEGGRTTAAPGTILDALAGLTYRSLNTLHFNVRAMLGYWEIAIEQ
jgi:hypothetical protein